MQRRSRSLMAILLASVVAFAGGAKIGHAQALWKYVDKNGKVTYSDKAPKKGETAQLVPNDPAANIIEAAKNAPSGTQQKSGEMKTPGGERENRLNQLREAVEAAKASLEAAKSALEGAREPLPDEVQIVVGRSATGAPTGANAVIRKPAYYSRIATLEENVKKAEENVEIAERDYRRGAP